MNLAHSISRIHTLAELLTMFDNCAGLTWYASSHGWLGSAGESMNAASRGGSMPPTTAGKDKVDEAPSATSATKPASQAHGGTAQGVSEGLKPK